MFNNINNYRRVLFICGLSLVLFLLCGALYMQFFKQEPPCPLCLLQRVGFIGIALGLLMNLKYGEQPDHWGIIILSALAGISVSIRQICLHITSAVGFAVPVFGLHLYTWCFIVFACVLLGSGVMLTFANRA